MSTVASVTDASFAQDVLCTSTPVLVGFYAVWSGASRAMTPHLQGVAQALPGEVAVFRLDIDANKRAPLTYQIRSIPTLLLFKGGQVVDQMTGNPGTTETLAAFVRRHLERPSRTAPSDPATMSR